MVWSMEQLLNLTKAPSWHLPRFICNRMNLLSVFKRKTFRPYVIPFEIVLI